MPKPLTVELISDPDLGGFTARLPDVPAYGEGETEDEAIADLKSALEGYIQTFGLDDSAWEPNAENRHPPQHFARCGHITG
jgi:predicted RNase H-like HicB family nuclease